MQPQILLQSSWSLHCFQNLHFCALHQVLAQPGSFEIRQTETLEKNSSTVLAMQNNKIETVRTDMSLYDMLTISSLFYFAKVPSL